MSTTEDRSHATLLVTGVTLLLLCTLAACRRGPKETTPAAASEPGRHHTAVAERGELVPISQVVAKAITIDGDLSNWGDLREESLLVHQLLDLTAWSSPRR